MEEKDTSNFKIGINDESQNHQFQEEMENIRIAKLSSRITFISVLIPCFIGIIIFIAYLDIKKRVMTVHDTGTTEVQNLSKELETKLSALTSKYKKFEDSLPGIKNNISSLQTNLNEAATAIKYIMSARETDNKGFNNSISKIETSVSSISNGLKSVSSKLKTIDSNFNKKLAALSKTADKISIELNKLKSDMSKLSSIKVDKKILDSTLKNERKLYDQKIDQLKKDIEKKINSIKTLRKTTPSEDTKTESTVIKHGGITEQDIQ
ncbi:MAG: hypothetical protein LWW97_03275 [Deltaproteobacteria bacterium]|nr:hypothetical protein [Deltaproteobacteria bacterium]